MKKIKLNWAIVAISAIITAIIILSLTGCNDTKALDSKGFIQVTATVKEHIIVEKYQVVEIEGCEYIIFSSINGYAGFGYMAHKGNCKNPIHIYKH